MHFLYALVMVASVFVFFSCTLPGFLHVTGIHKTEKIPVICVGLGVLFGIHLLFQFFFGCKNPGCKCKNCSCGKNCGKNCKCQRRGCGKICGKNCRCKKCSCGA